MKSRVSQEDFLKIEGEWNAYLAAGKEHIKLRLSQDARTRTLLEIEKMDSRVTYILTGLENLSYKIFNFFKWFFLKKSWELGYVLEFLQMDVWHLASRFHKRSLSLIFL